MYEIEWRRNKSFLYGVVIFSEAGAVLRRHRCVVLYILNSANCDKSPLPDDVLHEERATDCISAKNSTNSSPQILHAMCIISMLKNMSGDTKKRVKGRR